MKIKQGNDVRGLKYTVSKVGEQINFLEVDNLKVFAVNARHDYKRYEASEIEISSDELVIYFTAFPGAVGLYHLLVEFDIPDSVNEGGIRKIIRGWENAFQIVHYYEAEDTVGAEFVDEVTFGLDGKSYYTIWLKYHEGTEEEMIAWHRQPAVDAADELLSHPLYIGADHYVYAWDHTTQSYNKTEIYVKGDAFSIAKTYLSIAAMEADFEGTDTKPGDFVLIESGDVEDPDNSKLYVKGSTGWGYLTDLSGAIGFTGKTPQFSIGTVTTGAAGSSASVSISEDGIDANGNPKYLINFAIPKGDKGDKGDIGEKGDTGKNTYQYYFDNTSDTPKLTEAEWTAIQAQMPANELLRQQQEAARVQAELDRVNSGSEMKTNKITSLSGSSTDTQYPSAKLTYDQLQLRILKSDITGLLGTSETKVVNQKLFTDTVNNITDLMWYGIEWDITVAYPACTRIGNTVLHATLPIQSQIRRCLLLDTGVVNYYLDALDSTKKADGNSAILDGTDGQVMVETPAHYRKFEAEGNKVRCLISDFELPGFHYVPRYYRSAYEATVERATNKLSSVVNNTAAYRGGNNNAAWDAETRTQLGRAATAISLTNFRAYARNRGANWNCDVYDVHKAWFWLYSVEYANFNSQLAYNASPTSAGYKQGGLGDGVTTLVGANWNNWNSYYPFLPCGYTNSLGNRTGLVAFAMPAEYGAALTVQVPSYRGLENPFGHLWKWMDGCKVKIQAVAAGDKSEFYVCSNPAQFQDTNYTNYLLRGLLPRANGYIKQMLIGEFGEIMPKVATEGSSSTYFSDYFYTDIPASGESQRGVLFGGAAFSGTNAGLGYSTTNNTASNTSAYFGSRLCYIP